MTTKLKGALHQEAGMRCGGQTLLEVLLDSPRWVRRSTYVLLCIPLLA